MANVTATGSIVDVNVSTTQNVITITDVDTNVIVSNIATAVATVNVDSTQTVVNVAPLANISTATIRKALSVNDTGGYGSLTYANNSGVFTFTGTSDANIRESISVIDSGGDGSLAYNNGTGVFTYTGPNQTEANARIAAAPSQVRAHLSSTDLGGDGSFSYSSATGVMTYTGPDQAEANARIDAAPANVRAHFSATTGVANYNSTTGVITIPGTTDHITEAGNLWYTNARVKAYIENGTNRGHVLDINTYQDASSPRTGSLRTGAIFGLSGSFTSSVTALAFNAETVSLTDSDGILYNTDDDTYFGNDYTIPLANVLQPSSSGNVDATITYRWISDEWLIKDGTGTTYPLLLRSTTDLAEGANLWYTTDRANTAIGNYQGSIDTPGNITNNYLDANIADFKFNNNDLILNSEMVGPNDVFIRVDASDANVYHIPHVSSYIQGGLSATQAKFGTKSSQGSLAVGQQYQQSKGAVIPQTGNLTVECWVYPTSFGSGYTNHTILSQSGYRGQSSTPTDFRLYATTAGALRLIVPRTLTGSVDMDCSTTLSTGAWTHIAVTKVDLGTTTTDGDQVYKNYDYQVWVNGTLVAQTSVVYSVYDIYGPLEDSYLCVGDFGPTPNTSPFKVWIGFVDELRVSDTVRYTGTFTPSASAFTPDDNTVLLMHMEDLSQDLVPALQPALRWNSTANVWQFSNNSSDWSNISSTSDASTLNGQPGSYYLDYTNFTNTPTDLANFTNSPNYVTQTAGDTRYVNVTGDTMTGNLTISSASPKLSITETDASPSTGQVDLISKSATLNIQLPDTGASGGSPAEYNPINTNATGIWFNRDETGADTGLETPITIHASGNYADGNTIFWYETTQSTGYQGWHFENDDNVLRPFYQTAQANADIVAYLGDAANGPFTINGNLDVQGNLNYVNVTDLLVDDQSITLNYGNVLQDAFIYVDRTPSITANAHLKWNETSDQWEIYDGSNSYVIPRTTSDLTEGTNLYYTQSRFDTAFAAKTTTDLTEGTNLYYTTDRANTAIGAYQGNINTSGIITADYFVATEEFIGDLDGAISVGVYNNTASTLTKGMAVYVTGAQGDEACVAPANNLVASQMPAMGIVKENITAGSSGQAVTNGTMNFAGHGFSIGAELYVNSAGALTETKPTGEGALIQKIGKALASNFILVQGAGRTNATPNLNEGNIFLGDTNNQQRTVTPSTNFVTTGNAFELSNAITNVNSITSEASTDITLNTENKLIITQNVNGSDIYSGNITSSGYALQVGIVSGAWLSANLVNYANSDLHSYRFTGNAVAGSNEITITTIEDADTAAAANVSDITPYMGATGYPFTLNTYVTSVDAANSKITVSTNATANVAFSNDFNLLPAGVDTSTGLVLELVTDGAGGILVSQPSTIAYGYPKSGPVATDFNWSKGTSSDYTLGDMSNFTTAKTRFAAPDTAFTSPRGIVIGESGEMSNRGFDDSTQSFGLNILWDGNAPTDSYANTTNVINQILMRQYRDNSFLTSQLSAGGPRMFFASNYGNKEQSYTETYPRKNQELGRVSWWGASQRNPSPSSLHVPAFISVQAANDYDLANTTTFASGYTGGNADVYFGAISHAVNTIIPDVYLAYQGGRLTLASGNNQNIQFAPAESPGGVNPQNAYNGGERIWATINDTDTANSYGSKFTVTNGDYAVSPQVGDLQVSLKRIDNDGSVTNKEWILDLQEQSDDLLLTVDTATAVTFHSNTDVTFAGNIVASGLAYPTADGTNGQFIQTDGNGTLSFASVSGSGTVTSVDSGAGLTGGPITTSGTLAVGAGYGITVNADNIELNNTAVQAQANAALAAGGIVNAPLGSNNIWLGSGGSIPTQTAFDSALSTNITQTNVKLKQFAETVVALGSVSGDQSSVINAANGSIYTMTLTGGVTINSIANATVGTSMTLILTQDGTGNHTLTSSMKFAGGTKTLSTGPGDIDIISLFYDGTNYYASLTTDYQ